MDADGPSGAAITPLARNLAKRLAELFPKAAHLNVIRSWAGIIENSPDGRPIIDRLASPDNVVVASMSSVGFGLSPASGHAIRDLVIDGACSFANLSTFSNSRALTGWKRTGAKSAGGCRFHEPIFGASDCCAAR